MRKFGYAVLLLSSVAWHAAPAMAADDASAEAAADDSDAGSEITVTARRQEERAQDVPLALAVVSGGALERPPLAPPDRRILRRDMPLAAALRRRQPRSGH